MPTPITPMQANAARDNVKREFPELQVVVRETGYHAYTLTMVKEDGEELTLPPHDCDEGSGSLPIETRKRLRAFVDGTVYLPPQYISFGEFITGGANRYDDVMTHGSGLLHASKGEVIDGGVTEEDEDHAEMARMAQSLVDGFLEDGMGGVLAALRGALQSDDPAIRFAAAATILEKADLNNPALIAAAEEVSRLTLGAEETESDEGIALAAAEPEGGQEAPEGEAEAVAEPEEEAADEADPSEAPVPKKTRAKKSAE